MEMMAKVWGGRQAGRSGVEAENSLSLVSTSVPRNCRIK